jgi:H+-translocating NAD(P) transhydrogenase subunit alpha
MKIAVPTEIHAGECRVALTPDVVRKLVKDGYDVHVQKDAGSKSGYPDAQYEKAGATIAPDRDATWQNADIVLKLHKPETDSDGKDEVDLIPEKAVYVSFLSPMFEPALMKRIAARGCTAFSIDAIPRISRSQSMDALSSQANISGYKSVLLGANSLQKLMPMLMTAAGTIAPAKVFILGAGVAGLQAIATAHRLGAVVSAFDVRPAVKEQVKSLGAKFVEFDLGESGEGEGGYAKQLSEDAQAKQRQELGKVAKDMDIIITTAAIPGRKAPVLIEGDAVESMNPGAVIIDLAASTGGNVVGSKPDEEVDVGGVRIFGPTNLPSEMPKDASQMYAKNMLSFLSLFLKDKAAEFDWEDEILAESVITRDGEIVHEKTLARAKEL